MLGAQSQAGRNPFLGQPSESQSDRLTAHAFLSLLSREGSLECGSFLYISLYCAGPGRQMQGTPLLDSVQFSPLYPHLGCCSHFPAFWVLMKAVWACTVVKSVFLQGNVGLRLPTPLCCCYYSVSLFWNINSSWNKSDIVLMSKSFRKFFEKNLNFLKYLFLKMFWLISSFLNP